MSLCLYCGSLAQSTACSKCSLYPKYPPGQAPSTLLSHCLSLNDLELLEENLCPEDFQKNLKAWDPCITQRRCPSLLPIFEHLFDKEGYIRLYHHKMKALN